MDCRWTSAGAFVSWRSAREPADRRAKRRPPAADRRVATSRSRRQTPDVTFTAAPATGRHSSQHTCWLLRTQAVRKSADARRRADTRRCLGDPGRAIRVASVTSTLGRSPPCRGFDYIEAALPDGLAVALARPDGAARCDRGLRGENAGKGLVVTTLPLRPLDYSASRHSLGFDTVCGEQSTLSGFLR
jgi:hypothetical protein